MAYGGTSKGAVLPNFDNYGQGNANSNLGGQQPLRSAYNAAATTQADDYDKIMGGYDSLLNSAKNRQNQSPLNYTPVSATYQNYQPNFQYNRSSGLNNAITGLEDYAKTGGYSDSDVSNIRERGISPIRSIYANAQDDLRRQKVLSGGYSPNFGAVQAKLARQSSNQISDVTTKVNADIAKMVAEGKLSGFQALSPLVANENTMMNDFGAKNEQAKVDKERYNTEETNRVNEMNSQGQLDVDKINNANRQSAFDDEARALAGQTSLYGTTPALTQLFGNQVLQNNAQDMQAVTTANSIKNQRANIGLNLVQNQLGVPSMGRR
jgi:hypothetical protein